MQEEEEKMYNNVLENYEKATRNKIYVEGLEGGRFDIKVNDNKSVYVWGCVNTVVSLSGKCNHVFLYDSDKVVLRVDNCVSGITCMNSKNCSILITVIPEYNIEVSNSDGINIRSGFFNTPIVYRGVTMNIIKSLNCKVYEYYEVNDGILTNWNFNFFNF